MFQFVQLNGFLYVADFLFLAATATIIIKLQLEKSSQGFSAKTQGVYGVVVCTRNIDLLFVEGSTAYLIYSITKKIINISCIIYIVFKIKNTSKNTPTCNCNQDSFWVEALVLPCIIITAVLHYGQSPEEVLWSFSTYLETVAMVPQFYLLHVRGKGDSYLPAYISLMALYSFTDALAYCLNSFLYDAMPMVWPVCKCVQLAIYIWYFFIPREAVLPVANCDQRKRRTTMFMKQQSMIAQTLLKKNTSANDLQLFSITPPRTSASCSICSSSDGTSLDGGLESVGSDSSPPATPCIKFDVGFEDEAITLKAPIITTIRQLKNKGTLKLKSLPSSPELTRKLSSSSSSFFKPINEFTQFDTASSQRAKRMKRLGLSLPSTPEPVRKSELPFKYPSMSRSISQCNSIQLKKERAQLRSEMSLPTTPEMIRKNELILNAKSLSPHSSLTYLTLPQQHKYLPKRPPLPTVEGSPAFVKKSDQTPPISPLALETAPSPKPERPPPPKQYLIPLPQSGESQLNNAQPDNSTSETTNTLLDNHIKVAVERTDSKRCKPRRPPLPKLVISVPSTSSV